MEELGKAIKEYLTAHHADHEPFAWTKNAGLILRKAQKISERLTPPEITRNGLPTQDTSGSSALSVALRWPLHRPGP